MEIILSNSDEGERRFGHDTSDVLQGCGSQDREHGTSGAEKSVREHGSHLSDADEGDGLLHEPEATGCRWRREGTSWGE